LIDNITSHSWLSALIVGLLAFSGSAVIGLIVGIPSPAVYDEFSYLLAADTFAHGRLTNPTHSMWIHFESFHIFHLPTYMSKYPPGQGAILAFGQLLTGYPIVGVWLSMGMMCAGICWMLHAWVPPRWALVGGLFSMLHPVFGIGGYWAQSYWGGAVAAIGGALVLGGIRNLFREIQLRQSLLTGLGLAILANSRPFEGLLLSIGAALILFFGLIWKSTLGTTILIRKVILPLSTICLITATWRAYYNYQITRSVFLLPYQNHQRIYDVAPLFIWQKPTPTPEYRHSRIGAFHTTYELSFYNDKHSWTGFAAVNFKALLLYFVLAANVFGIPLLLNIRGLWRWASHNPWARRALLTYGVVIIGITMETYILLHYWAPIFALNYYFIVQAIRLWRRRVRLFARFITPALLCLVTILLLFALNRTIHARENILLSQAQRASLLSRLEHEAGKHLVLVKYGQTHHEWVYNKADIDKAKVVWAHDMGQLENCKLLSYFNHHVIWLAEIERDDVPVSVKPVLRSSCTEMTP
jgi:hypothetical protein